jgi:hypothetical protein
MLLGTTHVLRMQLGIDARTPVYLPTILKDGLDLGGQLLITLSALTAGALTPGIIATTRQPQHLAEHGHGVLAHLGGHKLILLVHCGIRERFALPIMNCC